MYGGQPILVLKEGTEREKGKGAQDKNIAGARAIADTVRTTLGPRGMDKMLVDSMGDVVITNDGVTILKEMEVEHPAAKMIIEVAKTQDQECGDGTTTAVILAGELLKNAAELLDQNVHPTIITRGFGLAADRATKELDKVAKKIDVKDKKMLMKIASTAMTGKSAGAFKDNLSKISVDAVTSIVEKDGNNFKVDMGNIKVEKKHGSSVHDTKLIQGVIVDKERVHSRMPKVVKNAKIALIDSALEVKKTEVDAKIQITDPNQLQAFLNEEEKMLKGMVQIVKKSGANVVFCQKGIDDLVQHYLAKEGIFAIRRIKKSDMEKLAKATGANVITKLDDLNKADLGNAGLIEEKKVADDSMTFVTKCKNPKAVSILVRGGTEHVADEIERSLNDALHVVATAIEDGKVTVGGGSAAVELAFKLRDYGVSIGGREQLAIEAFANALEVVPRTLAENAGIDPIDVLIAIRKAHKEGKKDHGLNVETGKIMDMKKLDVFEPLRVGRQAIEAAADVSVMILRIDDVVVARRGAPAGPPGGGMPPGMGGMM
jgi:thermosome